MTRRPASPLPAYAAALAGIGFFSIMDMVMKGLVLAIGIFPTMVWRSLIAAGLAAVLYLPRRKRWPSRATLRIHLVRGVLTTAMALLFFWGLARVPMAQAVALTFIAPLLALYLAAVLLDEAISARILGGSVAALAGVVVIFVGQARADLGGDALAGSIAILGSALIYAYNIVLMRQQALAARPLEVAFFQSICVATVLLVAIPFIGVPALPAGHWIEAGIAASLGIASLLLLAWGYARAGAAYLSSTEYSSFLWAMALGWLRFGESVSPFTLAGAALIVAGCVAAARTPPHPALEASA